MRRTAMALALLMAVGAVGLQQVVGGQPTAVAQEEGAGAEVDERARRVQERLGRLCGNYDFFFKHEFGKGLMRPVRCSRTGRAKTILVIYGFSGRRTKQNWLTEWGAIAEQRGAVVVRGKQWAVEVVVRRWADEVRERL
ncbi:MAG TPA: hypothetical protein VG318_13920 [Actinomycetota bacterium]|nr:hypothetical protein [Actinomycetota bacterium]